MGKPAGPMSQSLLGKRAFAVILFYGLVYMEAIEFLSNIVNRKAILSAAVVSLLTFVIALLVSLGSEALMELVSSAAVSLALLFIIILLGIFTDIIGTAAAASTIAPFNAKASRQVFGARHAVHISRNASSVANFCCDVIGDICGTVSGAIGAAIVFSIAQHYSLTNTVLLAAAITSLIAAVTVGGKALGKKFAIDNAEPIIFQVGLIWAVGERLLKIKIKNRK